MWKRRRKKEQLPWYRERNYKGNLTEAEKRQLDAFRMQPEHRADLPEDVQEYIGELELEIYERKGQETGAMGALGLFGAVLLVLNYFGGWEIASSSQPYLGGILLAGAAWFFFKRTRNKSAEQFPTWEMSDEALRRHWELNYIVNAAMQRREEEKDDD